MKNNELTEQQYVDKVINQLQKYFTIECEVWSDCKNGRIDLIVSNKNIVFGIECKRPDDKRGEEMGEFIKQAIRYSDYTFKGKKIPIFIAPALSYNYFVLNNEEQIINSVKWHKDRHNENHEHHSVNGFLGSMGIGEIRRCNSFFFFSFSNKIIWTSQKKYNSGIEKGLHEENYRKLLIKLGI